MREQEPRVVLTIGHSTRTWEAFLELLRAHRVKRIIDVRSIPKSRHNPQFNRMILAKSYGPRRLATCICEGSGACVIHDAIRRTWAGAMLHFVALLIICRPPTSMQG
jgi:Protein of unknown function, DUF488